MTDSPKVENNTITSASLSAVVIGAVQLIEFDDAARAVISTAIPILMAALVYVVNGIFIRWGVKPNSVLISETNMDAAIAYYRKSISEQKAEGHAVDELLIELNKSILARGKIYEDQASQK